MEDKFSLYDPYSDQETVDELYSDEGLSKLEQLKKWNEDRELRTSMNQLLEDGRIYYEALVDFRANRAKTRDFIRGHHYNQMVDDPDNPGTMIREEELILRKGRQPIINNQIRAIHKNLKGQYRDNDYKPTALARERDNTKLSEMLTAALHYALDTNNVKEIDASVFDEFLMSGVAWWREGVEWKEQRNILDVSVEKINPARCFWNTDVEDPLLKDLHTVGVIMDVHMDEMLQNFGGDDPETEEYLRSFYSNHSDRLNYTEGMNANRIDSLDFFVSSETDSKTIRVYELWCKKFKQKVFAYDPVMAKEIQYPGNVEEALEQVEIDNENRLAQAMMQGIDPRMVPLLEPEIKSERVWMYYYLTPYGHILDMGESPYWHEEHPFTIKFFPMIDSQVWGLLYDFLDQQQLINRTIGMLDHIMGTSSKNTLMIPEGSIPEGWTPEDFAAEYTRIGGYIVYKPLPSGAKPEELATKSAPANIYQLLEIQLRQLKEVSGVSEAMQGQRVSAGTPSSLYAQMVNNSIISIKDAFEIFFDARKERDYKLLKLIQQYYDEPRYLNIAGKEYSQEALNYNPSMAQDAEFDMVIGKSKSSPLHRDIMEERLETWLANGIIDIITFLENTSLPFNDGLRQSIQRRQEQLMAAQQQMPVQQ